MGLNKSFPQLVQYLTGALDNTDEPQMLKVRSLVSWLSNQDVDSHTQTPANSKTPEGFLALLCQKRSCYSTFFTVLCR